MFQRSEIDQSTLTPPDLSGRRRNGPDGLELFETVSSLTAGCGKTRTNAAAVPEATIPCIIVSRAFRM